MKRVFFFASFSISSESILGAAALTWKPIETKQTDDRWQRERLNSCLKILSKIIHLKRHQTLARNGSAGRAARARALKQRMPKRPLRNSKSTRWNVIAAIDSNYKRIASGHLPPEARKRKRKELSSPPNVPCCLCAQKCVKYVNDLMRPATHFNIIYSWLITIIIRFNCLEWQRNLSRCILLNSMGLRVASLPSTCDPATEHRTAIAQRVLFHINKHKKEKCCCVFIARATSPFYLITYQCIVANK